MGRARARSRRGACVHGLTDAMLADTPPIEVVLPAFERFAAGPREEGEPADGTTGGGEPTVAGAGPAQERFRLHGFPRTQDPAHLHPFLGGEPPGHAYYGPQRQEDLLSIIAGESQRLSRMIRQLLDLSRIEAGRMEWRLEALDLGPVVAQAVRANRSLFENKGIALTLEASNARAPVLAGRDKILQVLTDLLSNAAKFTPSVGKAWVRTFQQARQAIVEVGGHGSRDPPGPSRGDLRAVSSGR